MLLMTHQNCGSQSTLMTNTDQDKVTFLGRKQCSFPTEIHLWSKSMSEKHFSGFGML